MNARVAKKSPKEALDSSLKRLKAEPASGWSPDTSSKLHENVQRLRNSGLTAADVFDAEVKGLEYAGVFVVAESAPVAMADSRPWLELFRWIDVETTLGVIDIENEDPVVMRAAMDEGWDDRKNCPMPSGVRPICKLSEFVSKFKRRAAPKKGKSRFSSTEVAVRAGEGSYRYNLTVFSARDGALALGFQGQATKLTQGVATPMGTVDERGRRAVLEVDGQTQVAVLDASTLRVHSGDPFTQTQSHALGEGLWMIGSWRSHVVMSRTNQLVSLDVATGRHVQLDLESERPRMTDDLVIALETTPDGRSFLSSFTPGLELRARVELPGRVRWADYHAVASDSTIAIPGEKSIAIVRGDEAKLVEVRWAYKLLLTDTLLIAHDEGGRDRSFQAFDLDGGERWRVTSSTAGPTSYRGREMRLVGDTALAISEDGVIDAIDVGTGTLRWSIVLPLTKAEHLREDVSQPTLAVVPGGVVIVPQRHNSHAACAFFVELATGTVERVPHPEVIGVLADGEAFLTWGPSEAGGMTTVRRWTLR